MIGFTMTPSHIDYSKIIDADTVESLILGEVIILTGFAKELVPVDKGQLKNSIMWKMNKYKGGQNDGGGPQAETEISTPPENEGYVGSNLEYAGPVEYGRKDIPNYPRQPYLRPAIDYSKKAREARRKEIINAKIKAAYHG